MSEEEIDQAIYDLIDLIWYTAWHQGSIDQPLTGENLKEYSSELDSLIAKIKKALESED